MYKVLIAVGLLAAIPIAAIILLPLWLPVGLQAIGFCVNCPGWKVAEDIIAKGKDVNVCSKILIMPWRIYSPTGAEQRELCVFRFAKFAKDPSACELLMPSEYGLGCIGNIWGPLIDESNCHWYKENEVRCFEGEALTPHIYACDQTHIDSLPDECIHRIAFKEKNEERCDIIANATLQQVCKTRIAVWNDYPQLRSTIYFDDDIQ